MQDRGKEEGHGLLIVNTGDGKGKTTSAIGQTIRALGSGLTVCFVQFIKGSWETGESRFFVGIDGLELHTIGSGFTWLSEDKTEVVEKAKQAWSLAEAKVMSGSFDMVVLDELTYLITYGIISEETLLGLIRNKPAHLHLVITGRGASPGLLEVADLVTEMRELKHPYSKGIKAQKGIEY